MRGRKSNACYYSGAVDRGEYGSVVSKTSVQVAWQWSRFQDLSPEDLYEVVRLREAVFIVEQNCAYPDADGRDPAAWHLLGWSNDGDSRRLIAYARVFEPGARYKEGSVGRVVNAPAVRRTGVGKTLMLEALRRLEELAPGQPVRLAAQRYLENFYAGFGFTTASAPYEEDGIIHVDMLR
jgi:ElaA protein